MPEARTHTLGEPPAPRRKECLLPGGGCGDGESMSRVFRPHVLGVDDGPFTKGIDESVPVVGVMMEGAHLVEGVAVTRFPVDGDGATEFVARWIGGLRFRPALQGVVFGSVTIAGLGVLDVQAIAASLGLPVLIVNRKDPRRHRLRVAFETAGCPERLEVVERTPPPVRLSNGLFVAAAGIDRPGAVRMVRALLEKSLLPQPLRVAHLIARALVTGESRGRP